MILVAAGRGVRLGSDRPKALVLLGGKPIVQHALGQLLACPEVDEVVMVVPASHEPEFTDVVARLPTGEVPVRIVEGGDQRSDSVVRGLAALSEPIDLVLVHDAARALTPVAVFGRVIALLRAGHGAVVPVLPVPDTIKQVGDVRPDGLAEVVRTVDRSSLRAVQTPQGFRRIVLEHAHEGAAGVATDDAGLVEQRGGTVMTVSGDVRSTKITTPHDLAAATQWLEEGSR